MLKYAESKLGIDTSAYTHKIFVLMSGRYVHAAHVQQPTYAASCSSGSSRTSAGSHPSASLVMLAEIPARDQLALGEVLGTPAAQRMTAAPGSTGKFGRCVDFPDAPSMPTGAAHAPLRLSAGLGCIFSLLQQPQTIFHELGHNLYLNHAGKPVADTNSLDYHYGDWSGEAATALSSKQHAVSVVSESLYCVEQLSVVCTGAMGLCCDMRCFNAPHNYQLGWASPIATLYQASHAIAAPETVNSA